MRHFAFYSFICLTLATRTSCDFSTLYYYFSLYDYSEGIELMASKPDKFEIGHKTSFLLTLSGVSLPRNQSITIYVRSEHPNIATVKANATFTAKRTTATIHIYGENAGESYIVFNSTASNNISNLHSFKVKVYVVHSYALTIVNMVIGWIYFVAWSVSFYPQVFMNWSRKSVIGLNFDFLSYNILGFVAYGVFNVGMFWIPKIMSEYKEKHPNDDVNPVEVNDVFFTLHAILLTCITIFQCFIYDRGQQRVSFLCKILVFVACLFAFIALMVTVFSDKLSWLQYVYYFSYIKIGVTLIKYIPQVYMNFRRKSTMGWSIGNVLLDFTGGSFSIIQMIILSYNNNSWESIFGDLTKFALGLISILFDILFIIQHYVLYGSGKKEYEAISPIQDD